MLMFLSPFTRSDTKRSMPMRELVKKEVYTRMLDKNTRIEIASLGNDAGIIGAAFLGNS